ncbi:MAG: uroporphyrinogen decarboxylase family protein [Clostridia bacterium]|nr:uroporphyrinogen decarboxylase family protein [Clostridia bacterium]
MNMKNWVNDMLSAKEKVPMPILSFPSVSLLNIGVKELIFDPDLQAKGMKAVADRNVSSASVSMMDLSVEAEAFGSAVKVSDDEVPTVVGAIADNNEKAIALKVPKVGDGRTGIYVSAIEKAVKLIGDRPVFAGIIGPYSLAGRLIDINEIMINCYEEPEMVHTVLCKATEFLIDYAKAYKAVGANGIVMAEPLAGILSPNLAKEFSEPYVKKIVDAVQDDDFIVIYHNCGNNVVLQIDSILRTGAMAYHFGNSINMAQMLEKVPENILVMGNVDPAAQFLNGTPDSIKAETKRIMLLCCSHSNFVISSGCDIPPMTPWENIDAFFDGVKEFYAENN